MIVVITVCIVVVVVIIKTDRHRFSGCIYKEVGTYRRTFIRGYIGICSILRYAVRGIIIYYTAMYIILSLNENVVIRTQDNARRHRRTERVISPVQLIYFQSFCFYNKHSHVDCEAGLVLGEITSVRPMAAVSNYPSRRRCRRRVIAIICLRLMNSTKWLSHIFSVRRVYNIDITIYICAGTPRGQ